MITSIDPKIIPPQKEGGFVFSNRTLLWVGIYFICFFICVWNIPNPITGIDSGLKWLGAQRFANDCTIALPDIQSPKFPPVPAPFVEKVEDKLYPVFPPLPMILNGILFHFFTDRLWWFFPLLGSFGLLIVLIGYLKVKEKNHFFILLFFLATPIAVYSVSYWEHTPALFLLASGVILLGKTKRWVQVIAIFLLVLAITFRPELILFCLGLFYYLWKEKVPNRFFSFSFFSILIFVYLLLHKNWIGTWLPLQVVANLRNEQSTIALLLQSKNPFGIWWRMLVGAGNIWIEIIGVICIILFYIGYFRKNYLIYSIILIPILYLFLRVTDEQPVFHIITSNGIVFSMPFIVLVPVAFREFPEDKKWLYASVALFAGTLLMGQTVEGIHWSARLLLPFAITTTIVVYKMYLIKSNMQKLIKLITLLSALVTLYGVYWTIHLSILQKRFIQSIPVTGETIVSSIPWIGGDLAPLQFSQPIVFLIDREHAGEWLLNAKLNSEKAFRLIAHPKTPPIFTTEDTWKQLVKLDTVFSIPMPEKGYFYKYYCLRLTDDTLTFGKLAGELAALKFAKNDNLGIQYAVTAINWNPTDFRPAYAMIAFGLETRNENLIKFGLKAIPDTVNHHGKMQILIKRANEFLTKKQN